RGLQVAADVEGAVGAGVEHAGRHMRRPHAVGALGPATEQLAAMDGDGLALIGEERFAVIGRRQAERFAQVVIAALDIGRLDRRTLHGELRPSEAGKWMREAAVIGIAASDRHVETGHLCRSLRRRRSCGVRLCYDQLLNVSRKFCFELYRTASPNWEQTKNDCYHHGALIR